MGIQGLFPWIKKNAPNCMSVKKLSNYSIIGLDANLAMHRYARMQGDWLKGILFQIKTMVQSGVIPVYVLDGKPPKEKECVLNDRRKRHDDAVSEDDGSFKSSCKKFKVTEYEEKRFKAWCKGLGIRVIKAKGEADPLLVKMYIDGDCDAVWSEDGDLLSYGCGILIRKWKGKTVEEINLNKLLTTMNLTLEQFRKFTVFLGSDYAKRKYGPVTAMKKIDEPLEDKYIDAYKLLSELPKRKKEVFVRSKPLNKLEMMIETELPRSTQKYRKEIIKLLNC